AEDHGAFFALLQPAGPVGLVDERYPLALQVVGGMGVVDQHAEHVDRAVGLLANPLGDAERIHHPVAVTARRDLENFHTGGLSLREGRHSIPAKRSSSGSERPGLPRASW